MRAVIWRKRHVCPRGHIAGRQLSWNCAPPWNYILGVHPCARVYMHVYACLCRSRNPRWALWWECPQIYKQHSWKRAREFGWDLVDLGQSHRAGGRRVSEPSGLLEPKPKGWKCRKYWVEGGGLVVNMCLGAGVEWKRARESLDFVSYLWFSWVRKWKLLFNPLRWSDVPILSANLCLEWGSASQASRDGLSSSVCLELWNLSMFD